MSSFAVAAAVYTTLHSFQGGTDGVLAPGDSLIFHEGVLYGVAAKGGRDVCPSGCGLVYSLTRTADPNVWEKRTIYRFAGGRRGYRPHGQLLLGDDGALYGVASRGGVPDSSCADFSDTGCGLIYKLTPPETGAQWNLAVLYLFKKARDGMWPLGGLIMRGGVLFGTTSSGGSAMGGTAFTLTPPSDLTTPWTKTTLVSFNGTTGLAPEAALTFKDGKFYGATRTGTGPDFAGSVFELTRPVAPSNKWTVKVLHKFSEATGSFPSFVKVVFDAQGRLYGTASKGGANCTGGPPGCGVVFRLIPPVAPATEWTYEIIRRFQPGSSGFGAAGGSVPVGGIVFGGDGSAYGAASQGANTGTGVIYKLTPPLDDVGPWTETVVYSNTNSIPPQAPVIGGGRVLYGVLSPSLFGSPGEVFQIKQ